MQSQFSNSEIICLRSLSPAVDPPYEESPVYKHALTVVSKAAYKTLKRGASSYIGAPPQVRQCSILPGTDSCCNHSAQACAAVLAV